MTIVVSVTYFVVFFGNNVSAEAEAENIFLPQGEYTLEITDNDTDERRVATLADDDVRFNITELSPNQTVFNESSVFSSFDIDAY